jgi:hypothetical protein
MNISAKPFILKLFLVQLILTAILAFPMGAKAQVRVRRLPLHPTPDYRPMPQPGRLLEARINTYSRGRAQIPVLGLIMQQEGVRLRGPEIERIMLATRPLGRQLVQARLVVNDMAVTALKPVSLRSGRIVFGEHEIGAILNRTLLRSLKIEVIGEAMIEELQVRVSHLSNHTWDRPEMIIPVNQVLNSGQVLSLASLIPHSRHAHLQSRIVVLEVSAYMSSHFRPILNVSSHRSLLARETVSGGKELIEVVLPLGSSLQELLLQVESGQVLLHSIRLDDDLIFNEGLDTIFIR